MSEGGKEAVRADDEVVATSEVRRLEERVRELDGCSAARRWKSRFSSRRSTWREPKNRPYCPFAACGSYPVKTISATLGVARSNVIERRDGLRARRGRQECRGDVELAGAIRRFVDERLTYSRLIR